REHFLILDFGIEERGRLGPLGDVVPGAVVEGGNGRWRADQLRDAVLVIDAGIDLDHLIFVRLVAALIDARGAGRYTQGQSQAHAGQSQAAIKRTGGHRIMPSKHPLALVLPRRRRYAPARASFPRGTSNRRPSSVWFLKSASWCFLRP